MKDVMDNRAEDDLGDSYTQAIRAAIRDPSEDRVQYYRRQSQMYQALAYECERRARVLEAEREEKR
jgi:hypothetical protein